MVMIQAPLCWFAVRGLRTLCLRLRRPSGVLSALKIFPAFNNFNLECLWTIDNKNIRSNRIGQDNAW